MRLKIMPNIFIVIVLTFVVVFNSNAQNVKDQVKVPSDIKEVTVI